MRVIIGGTFAYLHKGHEALITKAFELGDYVCIGLTTDGYVKTVKPKEKIPPYKDRLKSSQISPRVSTKNSISCH